MLKFSPWSHSKSTYASKEEGGGALKVLKRTKGGDLPRVYIQPSYFKPVFSHLRLYE